MQQTIQSVLIVGGGSAGWMAAAMLSKLFAGQLSIQLVESDAIATVGVGEATIPPIQLFNNVLGIKEADFLTATQGTCKLGIEFQGWGNADSCYMHAFGEIGRPLGLTPFQHFWLRAKALGDESELWQYSLNWLAAKQGRFHNASQLGGSTAGHNSIKGLSYAYHFDAGFYAQFLRKLSEANGVQRIEGRIEQVHCDPESGDIQSLQLENGTHLNADLFIDCSGFRSLLLGQALQVPFEDWSHWLPCDRAVAMATEGQHAAQPYTRSIAHEAGWQWHIPLQHRSGNGLVYSSAYYSDEQALQCLKDNLQDKTISEPNFLRFRTGRRQLQWHKNCIALGLASGFLEPLESTSLHLVQTGITRLVKLFPHRGIKTADIAEYNRQSQYEFERIRDFIILHYHLNNRSEPFWQQVREMAIPESLRHKIELFRASGSVVKEQDELFAEVAWLQVLLGQGAEPLDFHPLAQQLTPEQLKGFMQDLRHLLSSTAAKLPQHQAFIDYMQQQASV